MTESQFQAEVIQLAKHHHWEEYHTHNSRRSKPGWPDLQLVKPPRLIVAELKSETGRLSAEQERWLDLYSRVPGVEVYVWRPRDLQWVAGVLAGTYAEEAA